MARDIPDECPDAGHEDSIDLKRLLLLRVTLFALAIGILTTAVVLYQARERIRVHIADTGGTVERLIASEAVLPRGIFQHIQGRLEGVELKSLDGIGQLLAICVAVVDIYDQPIVHRCFREKAGGPAVVRLALTHLIGPEYHYRGMIGQYPGIKVGEFIVTPDLDSEALAVWYQLRIVLGMTLGILLLNVLLLLPVRRVLRPTELILSTLERMEAGEIAVRMPCPRLIELRRIATGFNHLAERLQITMAAQRNLAQRLLAVREEERRYLARELHDEFGQCLTSIGAETAFITRGVRESRPELLPAAQSIATVTAHMMESLQGILYQLRPVGLEEFGLRAALEQLIGGWQRRQGDCKFDLIIEGEIDGLPDDLTVSIYRIAQESLTNALRHGKPTTVTLRLCREAARCSICVEDDGEGREPSASGSRLGVLGMNERVEALGGRFAIGVLSPRGARVYAEFPAEAMNIQRKGESEQDARSTG